MKKALVAVALLYMVLPDAGPAQSERDLRYHQRELEGCEANYRRALENVCNAPIRRRDPDRYARCIAEISRFRDRCLANAQRRLQGQQERQSRRGR